MLSGQEKKAVKSPNFISSHTNPEKVFKMIREH